jgi:hypothetical protein
VRIRRVLATRSIASLPRCHQASLVDQLEEAGYVVVEASDKQVDTVVRLKDP